MPCPPPPPPPRLATLALLAALALAAPGRSMAVINGSPAAPGEFPGIAALVLRGNYDFVPLLGGAVIVGDQWAVTAAHSVFDRPASTLQVWTGVTDLEDPDGRLVANVLQVFVHPDFSQDGGTSSSDLALLLLDRRLSSATVLELADSEDAVSPGDLGAVAGWGTTVPGTPEPSPVLLRAPAGIVENGFANSFFSGNPVDETHLAARDPDELQSPCSGDSGGPLVLSFPDGGGGPGIPKLVGLVSFGVLNCSDTSVPTAYTSVPFFAAWIRESLALTETPPGPAVFGRQRRIRSGRTKTRRADSTDFGQVRRFGLRARRFQLRNLGDGLLTVLEARVSGRAFRIRRDPPQLLEAGSTGAFVVEFEPRGRKKLHRGQVRIVTNHPQQLVYRFRVEGRPRR